MQWTKSEKTEEFYRSVCRSCLCLIQSVFPWLLNPFHLLQVSAVKGSNLNSSLEEYPLLIGATEQRCLRGYMLLPGSGPWPINYWRRGKTVLAPWPWVIPFCSTILGSRAPYVNRLKTYFWNRMSPPSFFLCSYSNWFFWSHFLNKLLVQEALSQTLILRNLSWDSSPHLNI